MKTTCQESLSQYITTPYVSAYVNELDNLGDTSTLADPGVVEELIANRHVK